LGSRSTTPAADGSERLAGPGRPDQFGLEADGLGAWSRSFIWDGQVGGLTASTIIEFCLAGNQTAILRLVNKIARKISAIFPCSERTNMLEYHPERYI